ncbi:MAG TPA: TSUP family transporter, partial [Rhodocyclaceae bacterium]|nr:TSUP family transporter [Rhodocyclaceae bacterium]
WGTEGLPAWTAGFVYLPALVLVSAVSSLTAPIGARLTHRLPVATLKKVFAGVLILLSAKMLHTVFGG